MLKNMESIDDRFILVEEVDDEAIEAFINKVECFGKVVLWTEATFTLKDYYRWLMSKHEMELYLKAKGGFLMTTINKWEISRAINITNGLSAEKLFKMYSIKE